MNASQIINYLQRIDGVEGCCIASADGQIVEKVESAIMDDAMFSEIVIEGSHLLETLQAGLDGCREVQLNFELKKTLIRSLVDLLLVIIVDEKIRMNDIRVAANIVTKRYNQSQATSPGPLTSSVKTEPKTPSFFSFGQKPKEEKPPKKKSSQENSIWG